jgi:cytochrome c oxidase subunit 2
MHRRATATRSGPPRRGNVHSSAGRAAARLLTTAFCLYSLPAPALAQDDGRPVLSHGLSYMTGFGPKNYAVVSLLWGTIILSLVVVTIVGVLVLSGVIWRRHYAPDGDLRSVPLRRSGSGLPFIYTGIGITFVILVGFAVWNYWVLAAIAGPRGNVPITIDITGHQWWWEVRYLDRGDDKGFTTANEIHLPLGVPVRVILHTKDVIHSFWVPALTGKMDTIPGQNNTTWLQADRAGIYRGQCTEYCGQQHAHMGFIVTAESKQDFDAWWRKQVAGPNPAHSPVPIPLAEQGERVFMQRCVVCHTVRGTMAQGKVGPDLSHLMDRKTIAAATVPNTPGYLSGWISDPQQLKPGNLMPTLTLSAQELTAVRSFLQTLQ